METKDEVSAKQPSSTDESDDTINEAPKNDVGSGNETTSSRSSDGAQLDGLSPGYPGHPGHPGCGSSLPVAVGGPGGQSEASFLASGTSGLAGASGRPHFAPDKPTAKDAFVGDIVESTTCSLTTEAGRQRQSDHSQACLRGDSRVDNPLSLRKKCNMLQMQTYLLAGSTVASFLLFLIFSLPLAALVSLLFFTVSLGAFVLLASSTVSSRYQLEMQHPLGLLRYLPDSLRTLLTETTLHDYMTDTTFFMENRYLLLYFVPGLTPDQLMNYINQLPPRHRDLLMQPGLGRLMPSIMSHLIRADESTLTPQLGLGGEGNLSTSSVLSFDRDHHERHENRGEGDAQVTLMEAIRNLRETFVAIGSENNRTVTENDVPSMAQTAPTTPLLEGPPCDGNQNTNDAQSQQGANEEPSSSNAQINLNEENRNTSSQSDDKSSVNRSDGSMATTTTTMTLGGSNHPVITSSAQNPEERSIPRGVVVNVLAPSNTTVYQNEQTEQQNRQREYDVEERILSEATSTAVANYSAQASTAISSGIAAAVEEASARIIQIGSYTGAIAGSGGLVVALFRYVNFRSPPPSTAVVAVPSSHSRDNNISGEISPAAVGTRNWQSISSRLVYGLVSTSAFGFVSAGAAYLVRNHVRATIAQSRDSLTTTCAEDGAPKEEAQRRTHPH